MTQVKFSDDNLTEFASRPYLIPSFIGSFTPIKEPLSIFPEEKRRGTEQTYGSGVLKVDAGIRLTNEGYIKKKGIPTYYNFETPEGSVKLPEIPGKFAFKPSSDSIDLLTHTSNTRLQGRKSRYY